MPVSNAGACVSIVVIWHAVWLVYIVQSISTYYSVCWMAATANSDSSLRCSLRKCLVVAGMYTYVDVTCDEVGNNVDNADNNNNENILKKWATAATAKKKKKTEAKIHFSSSCALFMVPFIQVPGCHFISCTSACPRKASQTTAILAVRTTAHTATKPPYDEYPVRITYFKLMVFCFCFFSYLTSDWWPGIKAWNNTQSKKNKINK